MSRLAELESDCKAALVAGLRPQLKDAIDRLLDGGVSKTTILRMVRESAAKAQRQAHPDDPQRGQLTIAAVEAYLDSR